MTHSEMQSFSGQTSEVLNSERFNRLLNESEESVHKLIADIAMKFYKLGLEEGLQAAISSGVKTVSFPEKLRVHVDQWLKSVDVSGRRWSRSRTTTPS